MRTAPFRNSYFGDKRLTKRANSVMSAMISAGSCIINRIYCTTAEKTAAYRMINNDNITCEAITEAYRNECVRSISSNDCFHVLCLQDTCEVNYEAHSVRMHKKGRKPGCVSNEEAGCFLHPVLAIDADSLTPHGFTFIKMWNREKGTPRCTKRGYKSLAPEQKESYRWAEAIDSTRELLGGKVKVTMLSDRESDVYEVLKRADDNVRIIVRSNQNRRLKGCNVKLHDKMAQLPVMGTYQFMVPASHGRKARMATMEVRFANVELERPANSKKDADANVRLNCIRVSESSDSVPHGAAPIEWILLTNHEVATTDRAMQCVNWYKCRWFIEELFRLLKKKGFAIEDIQLEDTECLEKDILFAAYAAMHCILLKHAFDNPDYYRRIPAYRCYDIDEIETANFLMGNLNGRTVKQQNPYHKGSLAWMAWIVARLGCWCGYMSQPRPGYTTFKSGLDRLFQKCEMYKIMKDVYKG